MNSKTYYFLLILLPLWQNTFSQNLLENASFEAYSNRLSNADSFHCMSWTIPNHSTPDYFSAVNIDSKFGMPYNLFGKHSAFDGQAYIGLCLFKWDGYVEQITGSFKKALMKDSIYKISLLIEYASKSSYLKINELDIKFHTNRELYLKNIEPWYDKMFENQVIPDVELNISSCDTTWKIFAGMYKAKGDENYFTIGLFFQSDVNLIPLIREFKKAWPKGEKYENRFYKRHKKNSLVQINKEYNSNSIKVKMAYYFIDNVSVELVKK